MIYYAPAQYGPFRLPVKMEGRGIVGTIRQVKTGYQYQPRGSSNVGDVFSTLEACKRSLED